jgi:hypothetical protein
MERMVTNRRCLTMIAAVTIWSALLAGAGAAAQTHAAVGGWGTAQPVPGLAALNTGHDAVVNQMSCPSAGNCGAGGFYSTSSAQEAFVVSETNGTWGTAQEIPGMAALDRGQGSAVSALSCGSAGNCSAVGFYAGLTGVEAFVADEINGTWGTAEEVPGTAALNKGGNASTDSVSCASAGNCSAGGSYEDGSFHDQAFVVDETNGTWGTAQEVPGAGALNVGGHAEIDSVSCASAGNCSAAGRYGNVPHANRQQVFVVDETNGTWGTAQEVPGFAALSKGGGQAAINSLSCASAGNCSAGGFYPGTFSTFQAFVVTEKNGTWGKAEQVPGTAALNKGGFAGISAVSCGAAGNCSAGGSYRDTPSTAQAFVVTEKNGTWGKAEQVPGSAALNKGGAAGISAVSCAPAGHCSAGGSYTTGPGQQGLVVGRT